MLILSRTIETEI